MIKVYTATFKTKPLDIKENYESAKLEVEKAICEKADLIVFPKGYLTGVELGILSDAPYFRKLYNDYTLKLANNFIDADITILADLYTRTGFENNFFYKGKEKACEVYELNGVNIANYNNTDIFSRAFYTFADDSNLVILNDSPAVVAGQRALLFENLKMINKYITIPCIVNLGGYGYTSHPNVYMPCVGIFSQEETTFTTTIQEYMQTKKIFDVKIKTATDIFVNFTLKNLNFDLKFNKNPLIPQGITEETYCLDLFHLQSYALATRLENIGCKNVVIAVSGGLDSALAFLVCVNAFKILNLDLNGITALTMPGFGTSKTTNMLAHSLVNSFDIQLQTIDITKACMQALDDINHDGKTFDITFENVQARMRTLNALNIANSKNAIMVGTGDLSEEALGFCTYGGDHLASYNVNSSISKTVIRTMLPYILNIEYFTVAKDAINNILNIPVSPELIPHGGEIGQKTEEILSPYKLIDFYIYCFVVAKMSPIEMAQRASCVFEGEFTNEYLKDKAYMFCKRFISGQFKRSAAPEGAILTHVHLNTTDRSIASDASMGVFNSYFN